MRAPRTKSVPATMPTAPFARLASRSPSLPGNPAARKRGTGISGPTSTISVPWKCAAAAQGAPRQRARASRPDERYQAAWRSLSAQKFDADLRLRAPDHATATAGAEIQGHVDVKKVGDLFRGLDHEAGAVFGFVPNRAFAQLLADRVYKPATTTHQRALTAACIRLNLRMICVGHLRPPTALSDAAGPARSRSHYI